MFTGLVEVTGTVTSVSPEGGGKRIAIRCALPLQDAKVGDSIAVDGVCLTAERLLPDGFEAVAGRETLAVTTLVDVRPGRRVHLERALRVGDRLGGHIVQGHVDGTARLLRTEDAAESRVLWFEVPAAFARYLCPKGSVCLDGVSLTVNEVDGCRFRVNIVPHTVAVTRLGELGAGDRVNIEVDVLAKHVERLLGFTGGGLTLEHLQKHGFAP